LTRPTPWSLTVHDGSGNTFRFRADGPGAARYEYSPVTPRESSSGVYSGGAPQAGALPTEEAEALWLHAERLEQDTPQHAAKRAMGTGSFHLATPAGARTFLVRPGPALGELWELLDRYRRSPEGG
jgi:hypothetical protein